MLASATARAVALDALPQGEVVRHGYVDIVREDGEMRIAQASELAIIDWRSFDIGARASVHVLQRTTETALLNRVTGQTTSELAGALHAGGHVYLVNPNGIRVAPSGTVGAAAFVASTLDLPQDDFRRGVLRFGSPQRGSLGTIVHDGRIDIDPGGFVALLGLRIEQRGQIRAPLSQVALGAGTSAALTPGRDAFLTMAQAAGARPAHIDAVGSDGNAGNAGNVAVHGAAGRDGSAGSAAQVAPPAIVMAGDIEALGGYVRLEAPIATTPDAPPDDAISISGAIRAPQRGIDQGTIRINGIGGAVRLSGLLDASSNEAESALLPGGTVSVYGARVVIERMGINVSGAAGGGRVTLATGGGERPVGGTPTGPAAAAPSIHVARAAAINASATRDGRGGDIHVLSDGPVLLLGRMQARGVERAATGVTAALMTAAMTGAATGMPDDASLPYCHRISFHAARALSPLALPAVHPLATPFVQPGGYLFGKPARPTVDTAATRAATPAAPVWSPVSSPSPMSFASRLASPLRIPDMALYGEAAAAAAAETIAATKDWSADGSAGPSPDPSAGPSVSPPNPSAAPHPEASSAALSWPAAAHADHGAPGSRFRSLVIDTRPNRRHDAL